MKKYVIVLSVIAASALFFRTYRISDLLAFGFDQGRDAKVIWNLWHDNKFFLIGPTTGIEGIFLGPFYYYLIAPWYIVFGGNPVAPATFLGILNVGAILIIAESVRQHISVRAAIITALFISISHSLISYSRWLSNPTPLPFFAALAIYSLCRIVKGYAWWFPILALCVGVSLQLEAASAIFFIPATLVILAIYHRDISWKSSPLILAVCMFLLTLLPQLIFDFRHDHLLLKGFGNFLIAEKSFRLQLWQIAAKRINFYHHVIGDKFFDYYPAVSALFINVTIIALIKLWRKRPKFFDIFFVWTITPFIFLFLYQGNNGYVWDYYFMGIFGSMSAVFAIIWDQIGRWGKIGRFTTAFLLSAFIVHNLSQISTDLFRSEPELTSLTNQLKAVEWIHRDSQGGAFNVDVYVPPVIPHAYDYLFIWQGNSVYHRQPEVRQVPLLYTLHEYDGEMPVRREKWLARQEAYGRVEYSHKFGGITVDRRVRIK